MWGMKNSTMLKCYQSGIPWDGFIPITVRAARDSFGKAAKSKITEWCLAFLCF